MTTSETLVLVSGASGYVACHVIKQLQDAGYRVRGTVRSLKNETKCQPIRDLCPNAAHPIDLVEADLLDANSWSKAVEGCTYVLHTASPLPAEDPKDDDELIKPAVEGTLNVLRAAKDAASVKRVVVTGSLASVVGGLCGENGKTYSEEDFHDPESKPMQAYPKSKLMAEKAAWDFVKADDVKFELAVMNPGFIIGPPLGGNADSTSVTVIKQLMHREMPMIPRLNMPCVDVRDIARAHVIGMTLPEAAGKRHCLVNEGLWFKEIAEALKEEFGSQGYNVPTGEAPKFMLWIMGRFNKSIRMILPSVNAKSTYNTERMRDVLKIEPIASKKTLVDMTYAAIEKGFVKKTSKYTGPPQA